MEDENFGPIDPAQEKILAIAAEIGVSTIDDQFANLFKFVGILHNSGIVIEDISESIWNMTYDLIGTQSKNTDITLILIQSFVHDLQKAIEFYFDKQYTSQIGESYSV